MRKVDHPWQLTREEWDAERERVRPNVAQSNFTRASGSEAVTNMKRLEWLLFDAHHDARARLKAATDGVIEMDRFEAEDLLDIIRQPIRYDDVITRARALGLIEEPA